MTDLPLHNVRVLDLTRLLPGPYASLVFAELGAEVIKVEEPPSGDPLRYLPLPNSSGGASLFGLLNRNKKSLSLNLKATEGQAILYKLARHADVLVEGFRPGVMQRLGLDYAALAAVNPGLIYASISGYGQKGPHSLRAGHDLNYIAMGGLLSITGTPEGDPVIPGVPIADLTVALWTALGVVAALLGRQNTGRGQYLDMSMLNSVTSLLVIPLTEWLCTGSVPQRGRMILTGRQACYNVYRTSDGRYMTLAALEPHFWRAFCLAVGHAEWLPRQNDVDQVPLIAEVAALFATHPRDYWTALLANADCCCEPMLALDEAFAHPQAMEYGLLCDGQLTLPVGRRGVAHAPVPRLGEHNLELLSELGYSEEDTERLRQQGII